MDITWAMKEQFLSHKTFLCIILLAVTLVELTLGYVKGQD